jgi:hypothetical protein
LLDIVPVIFIVVFSEAPKGYRLLMEVINLLLQATPSASNVGPLLGRRPAADLSDQCN